MEITALANLTPETIDTELATLHIKLAAAYSEIDRQLGRARKSAGESPMKPARGKRPCVWRSTNEQARERLVARVKLATGVWTSYNEPKILATLVEQEQLVIVTNQRIAELEDEYGRRPWNRFFLVTSSDGHIHSSQTCSTCTTATVFAWLPQSSGRTEAEAVATHGPLLCSVCFPSAPVEWTRGRERQHCSGTTPKPDTIRRWARGQFGECPTCGKTIDIKANGELKRHQPPTSS